MIEQRSALHLLKDNIKLFLLLEKLDYLQDVNTIPTMQIDLDLLEDSLTIRMTILVNDLDGILLTRVDVLARPDLAVSSLSEDFARERVNVRETIRLHVCREASLLLLGS
jgi:hypothetical protein